MARKRVRREARGVTKEGAQAMLQPWEAVAMERRVVSAKGAMNVVGPPFAAVSKSPTIGQGGDPSHKLGEREREQQKEGTRFVQRNAVSGQCHEGSWI